jgi:hypothetical protein
VPPATGTPPARISLREARTNRILEIDAAVLSGGIVAGLDPSAIAAHVMDDKKIVVLKHVFPEAQLSGLRRSVLAWGLETKAAAADDFRGNYHRQRVLVSRLQQAPHVFHDYNFNAISAVGGELGESLRAVFEPLRRLYSSLTRRNVEFSIPDEGPYVHPQIIHYPNGGGFFGRHWHNLEPQRLGFIVMLSEQGRDFHRGATVFDIDGEIVDMEGRQQLGDICVWRYDYHHWVTQSDLSQKFDWSSTDGRWVATFAYFDPNG